MAEGQKKKPQKKQALPSRTREEEEDDEEEDEEEQSSAAKKDIKADVAGQIRKRRVIISQSVRVNLTTCVFLFDNFFSSVASSGQTEASPPAMVQHPLKEA